MKQKVLIAGVGNVFFGDDGFGVEVARRLRTVEFPEGVRVEDFGIRGVHLAFELLNPVDLFILVDAMSRSGRPGSLYLVDPEDQDSDRATCDSHALDPFAVLAMVRSMGGSLPKTRIIGCEPEDFARGMSLSQSVMDAVDPAISMIHDVLEEGASQ